MNADDEFEAFLNSYDTESKMLVRDVLHSISDAEFVWKYVTAATQASCVWRVYISPDTAQASCVWRVYISPDTVAQIDKGLAAFAAMPK